MKYDYLVKFLAEEQRKLPGVWSLLDTMRSMRGQGDVPDWDSHVFLPDMGYRQVLEEYREKLQDLRVERDIHTLSALAAWRPAQDIIEIDNDVLFSLADTPVDKIPPAILERLPSWCVYVPLEAPEEHLWTMEDEDVAGCFVFYGHTLGMGDEEDSLELRFMPVSTKYQPYQSFALDLTAPTLEEAMLWPIYRRHGKEAAQELIENEAGYLDTVKTICGIMVSVTLYIIEEFENRSGSEVRYHGTLTQPSPKRTKKGWRLFPPDKPKVWKLGEDVGEQIRSGRETAKQAEHRKGPRPHIRRAHWHTYWTGRKVWKEGEVPIPQTPKAKWLPPIAVALEDDTVSDG